MSAQNQATTSHDHNFLGSDHQRNERKVWLVIALTASMMVIEIVAGSVYGSMALVADAVAQYGRLDIFFANAGISGGLAGIFEQSAEDWAEILDKEMPDFDEDYNDNENKKEVFRRMYNVDYEESEDGLMLRPVV